MSTRLESIIHTKTAYARNPQMRFKVLFAMLVAAVGAECLLAGTIAFYPFTEGESGSSALSTELLNSVDPAKFKGTSIATYPGQNLDGVKFSDDIPGMYLFDGTGFKEEPYVDSFGSIQIWGRKNADGTALNNTSSATVSFENLAKELSTNSSWTIEFFHKINKSDFVGEATLVAFDAGYSIEGVSGALSVFFSDVKGLRGRLGTNASPGGTALFYLHGALNDMRGVWSHFALTYNGATGVMTLFHNHVNKSTATFAAGAAAEHAAMLFGNKSFRGKICALRVSDRVLAASEMLYASDNPTQTDRQVWDLPVEGIVGATVESEHAFVDGEAPVYAARRQMNVVDGGVVVGVTSNCAHLVTTSKTSSSETFARGPGLKVSKNTVSETLSGSFTMEGFFKFDAAEWERKIGSLVIGGVAESRKRMTIMGQAWVNGNRNQLWAFGLSRASAGNGYNPRIDCVYYDVGSGSVVSTAISPSAVTLTVDGNWHRYVVTYSQPTHTFVCYEDDREILRTTLPGDLVFEYQGDWYVGAKLGNHPFEGYVDSIRLSRGVLPTSAFRTMERIYKGITISYR